MHVKYGELDQNREHLPKTGQQDNVDLERRVREMEISAGCRDCGVSNFVAGLATPGKVPVWKRDLSR